LQGGFEQVWTKRFSGKVRTHVRKAEKSGLQIQCDTAGALVSSFYELYVQSIERWAQQHHEPRLLARWRNQRHDPIDKFKRVAERLGENCQIWLAQLGGQPVAAMIVLRQGANASYWRGAMNKSLATQTRANDLLQQLAIEDACRSGCHFYHMGETGASRSLAHFKECFGAQAFDYHEYRLERLPLTRLDTRLRGIVKRLLRFRDA
jgi:lipid II:glycine glycyltransferase (peptidoglycan interpeptide bridge formation enzyme)